MLRSTTNDRPIPLRFDDDELFERDRRSFTRTLAGYVLAKVHGGMPEQVVRRAWPHDDSTMLLTRAAVNPTDTTSGAAPNPRIWSAGIPPRRC